MLSAANAATLLTSIGSSNSGVAGSLASFGSTKNMTTQQIDKVSKDFESMFVGQMMEQMFGESTGADAFGDEDTNEVYKGLMMDEYGKQITNAGGIGIADYVKRELLSLQEKQP